MDQTAILNRIKDNALNIAIIFVAFFIAFKITKKNETGLVQLKAKAEIEASKSQLLGEIGAMENRFSSLKVRINNKSIDSVIGKISNVAQESSVNLINIKPLPEKRSEIYSRYSFELQLSCADYHSIGKFISILERSPDLYFIDTLGITPGPGGKEKISARVFLSTILINEKN